VRKIPLRHGVKTPLAEIDNSHSERLADERQAKRHNFLDARTIKIENAHRDAAERAH
jgi:hypothetical protein